MFDKLKSVYNAMARRGRGVCAGLAAAALAAGCAALEHGWVVDELPGPDGGVRVRLGGDDGLAAGDRVDFFDFRCEEHLWALGEQTECTHVRVGGGTVLTVEGPTAAIVRPDLGTPVHWSQHTAVSVGSLAH